MTGALFFYREVIMDIGNQLALLMQGTEYGDEDLKRAMESELRDRLTEAKKEGTRLTVYCGYDPRTSDLHLGHTVTMRKLRQFQDLGHHVVFLVGSFTSLIGDPSDKDKLRPILSQEEVLKNGQSYAGQAYRVLDREKTTILYNHKWLAGLSFAELIKLGVAARKIMTTMGEKPNIGIILGILPGTDGTLKMSKSLGNHIPLNSSPEDMYGKVMSIPDNAMVQYARLVTRWLPGELAAFTDGLAEGKLHPRDAKMQLAKEITATYYSEPLAEQAEESFVRLFQAGQAPSEMDEFTVEKGQTVLDVLLAAGMVSTRSEGRRMVEQKAVRLDNRVLADFDEPFPGPGVLKLGKRKFIRILGGSPP